MWRYCWAAGSVHCQEHWLDLDSFLDYSDSERVEMKAWSDFLIVGKVILRGIKGGGFCMNIYVNCIFDYNQFYDFKKKSKIGIELKIKW